MHLFNINSSFMQKLSLLFDIMVLNLLTVFCTLPIITTGAAISALYDSVYRLRLGQGTLFRNYFRAFRRNFFQATLLFIPMLLLMLLLSYSFLVLYMNDTSRQIISYLPFVICVVVWTMIASWAFPLQTRFENKIGRIYINACLCALHFLPKTIVMVLINLAPLVNLVLYPELFLRLFMVWLFVWFGFSAYLNTLLLEVPMEKLEKISKIRNENTDSIA